MIDDNKAVSDAVWDAAYCAVNVAIRDAAYCAVRIAVDGAVWNNLNLSNWNAVRAAVDGAVDAALKEVK